MTLTVVTPATNFDLVTLEEAKEELGITADTEDSKIQRWITATSIRFANLCNTVFVVEGLSETFRGYSRDPLVLSRRPVIAVSSVTAGGSLLATDDYELSASSGLLSRVTGNFCANFWSEAVVAYTAGYDPIPADVADAVVTVLRNRYLTNSGQTSAALKSFTIEGVGREDYVTSSSSSTSAGDDLPAEFQPVADTIWFYRNLALA